MYPCKLRHQSVERVWNEMEYQQWVPFSQFFGDLLVRLGYFHRTGIGLHLYHVRPWPAGTLASVGCLPGFAFTTHGFLRLFVFGWLISIWYT